MDFARLHIGSQLDEFGHPSPVEIEAPALAAHSLIIAASRSGKSYFLGRLMEEILLRTEARCLVLDPNSDFFRIAKVSDTWPAHETLEEKTFSAAWGERAISIGTATGLRAAPYTSISLRWPLVSMDLLADDLPTAADRGALYQCHSAIKSFAELSCFRKPDLEISSSDLATLVARVLTEEPRRGDWASQLHDTAIEDLANRLIPTNNVDAHVIDWLRGQVSYHLNTAFGQLSGVPQPVKRFYAGKLRSFDHDGLVGSYATQLKAESLKRRHLEVVDLPSLRDRQSQLLAVHGKLAEAWTLARSASHAANLQPDAIIENDPRTATFIVVDEAHNLMPAEAHGRAAGLVKEQFRTIAAEGKKYGIYLVIATQRIEKIDPLVVSECTNGVMMRSDHSVADSLPSMFIRCGETLHGCPSFTPGQAILAGDWVDNHPREVQFATRRTQHSGRSLPPAVWALAQRVISSE